MENELSIKISASLEKASKELEKFIPKLNKTDNAVSKMLIHLDKNGELNGFTAELDKLSKSMDKVTNKSNSLKNALSLGTTFFVAKKMFNMGYKWIQSSVDYSEALNLFNVVLDESIDKGMKFQNVMNEAFGTNQAETLTRQGLYQSMAENMGIAQEYAYIMSETSTKLVNDISSLYNRDENTVAEALRAGIYAGQTKPLRSFGMDITESSLQPLLNELNIKNEDGTVKTVRQLSQAEKQILRYIAVLRQSAEAQGDWANTIEAPANQLKIFKNQLVEAQRALANLFVGTFAQVLPYANALLMVIKEVANAIASILGIEISDYNTGIADMSDSFVDLEDSVGDASDAVKELKRQTLGFDQINNINESKNKSGSGNTTGGIDQRLLDAITGYDNGMDKVRMKATEIRDKIMEWLGFTKEIDPLTGKVSFKYGGLDKTLKNIWTSFKGLSTTGKILVGLGLVAGATKLYSVGKKIFNLLGGSGLVKTVASLVSPFSSLIDHMKLYINLAGGNGLTGIKKFNAGINEGTQAWLSQLTAVDRLKLGLIGGGGLLASLGYMNEAIESIATNGMTWANTLQAIGSGLGSIASGASLGTAILPGWGTLIGAVAGGLAGLVTGFDSYDKAMNTNLITIKNTRAEIDSLYKEWEESQNKISSIMSKTDSEATYHQNLLKELTNIVDENGKIKQGYEDRATTIVTILKNALGIEIEIVDGQIKKYDELKNKINEVIEKKKAQARLSVLEEEATKAVQKRDEAEKNVRKTVTEREEAEKNLIKKIQEHTKLDEETAKGLIPYVRGMESLEDACKRLGLNYDEMYEKVDAFTEYACRNQIKALEQAESNYEKANNQLINYNQTIYAWEKATEYATQENYGALNYFFDHERYLLGKSEEEQNKYWKKVKKENQINLQELEKSRDLYGEELYNKLKAQYSSQIVLAEDEMNKLKFLIDTKNGEISDSTIESWKQLGEQSEEKFLSYLKLLPSDLQTEVVDKMKDKGFKVSDELQKGLDKIKPTVDISVDTSKVKNGIAQVQNLIKYAFGGGGTGSFGGGNGGGAGFRANGGIYANGKWHNIGQYASGGLPSTGEMFIAREKGPELVGSIGNKTAVMNNGQIVASVSAGVYNAVASAMSQIDFGGQDIRVYTEEGMLVEKVSRGIQQHVNRTGELPFTVPA